MRCAPCAIRCSITVIEDAACAAGSTYRARPAGAGAALAAFSFHPRKLLTTGEGGMITTADEVGRGRGSAGFASMAWISARPTGTAASNRSSSITPRSVSTYRMTDIQAAIGLVQLRKLPEMVARRRALARRYQELLAGIPGLLTADDPAYGETNYQSFWMLLPEESAVGRDDLLRLLADAGISARRGIMAAHLEPAYADVRPSLPVTERLTARSLILPLFHEMT